MHTTALLQKATATSAVAITGKLTTNPLQRKAVGEDEDALQMKQSSVQLQEGLDEDEDEPLQMKQSPAQLQTGLEEDNAVQMKAIPVQRAEAEDDEELLQMKMNPLQLKATKQNPLQPITTTNNPLQRKETEATAPQPKKENHTGLPDNVKAGVEALSGYSLDDVKVHYNSDKPAQLQALAYAQGTDIHVAPGQEQHLPHEAWHVVQQKQGRVQPTLQMRGEVAVNDDERLESEANVMGEKALQAKSSYLTLNKLRLFYSNSDGIVQKLEYKYIPQVNDFAGNAAPKNNGSYGKIKVQLQQTNKVFEIYYGATEKDRKIKFGELLLLSLELLIKACEHHLRPKKRYNQERKDNSQALLTWARSEEELVQSELEIFSSTDYNSELLEKDPAENSSDRIEPGKGKEEIDDSSILTLNIISTSSETINDRFADADPETLLEMLNNPGFFKSFRDQLLDKLVKEGNAQVGAVKSSLAKGNVNWFVRLLNEEGVPADRIDEIVKLSRINAPEGIKNAVASIHQLESPDKYTGNKACEAAAYTLSDLVKNKWQIYENTKYDSNHFFLKKGEVYIDGTWKQFLFEYAETDEQKEALRNAPNIFAGTIADLKQKYEDCTSLDETQIVKELNTWLQANKAK